MAIQLILCMETNKKADTDGIYITEVIRHIYQLNNQIKISRVYMDSKNKYNSKSVLHEIKEKTLNYISGETKIIYCIDTDYYEKNMKHASELTQITHFCEQHDYDLIWFCHDVEDVFLGKKISDSQKVQEAGSFRRNEQIKSISHDKLSCNTMRVHTSNILNILDKYLVRK